MVFNTFYTDFSPKNSGYIMYLRYVNSTNRAVVNMAKQ